MHRSDLDIRKFPSLELLRAAVIEEFARFVPAPQLGFIASAKQFAEWRSKYENFDTDERFVAFLLPDPSGYLTFPTIRQEIQVFRRLQDERFLFRDNEQIASEFGFHATQLDQPIYTLSGGERVRASLLKVNLHIGNVGQLVLCIPAHWLHRQSYEYLEKVVSSAKAFGKPVIIFSLQGDDWPTMVSNSTNSSIAKRQASGPKWFLHGKNFKLNLGSSGSSQGTSETVFEVFVSDVVDLQLQSPTLLIGPNGSGKSLLAQCLCAVRSGDEAFCAKSKLGVGPGRLVMQDALAQLFRTPIALHAARVFDFDVEGQKRCNALFKELCDRCREVLWTELSDDAYLVGPQDNPSTLLQAKLMLVAARLVHPPTILVMDEPAWGLSRRQATAFYSVVTDYCHSVDVPVLIICHETNWLENNYFDVLEVSRNGSAVKVARGER